MPRIKVPAIPDEQPGPDEAAKFRPFAPDEDAEDTEGHGVAPDEQPGPDEGVRVKI